MQISEPAEYIILGLLKDQPMYGYEMFQQFEIGTLGQIVRLEMSQMYAFLKKLEKLGYIETQLEPQGARPPRKIHSITSSGETVLIQWLMQPIEKPRDIRILFLIKLYFIQRFLPHQTGTFIEQELVACQRFLDNLEAKYRMITKEDDSAFFDHVVLRGRIHQTRSLLDWMRELQTELVRV